MLRKIVYISEEKDRAKNRAMRDPRCNGDGCGEPAIYYYHLGTVAEEPLDPC